MDKNSIHRKEGYPEHVFAVQCGLAEHLDQWFMASVDVHVFSLQIVSPVIGGEKDDI